MMLVNAPSIDTCKPHIGKHVCVVFHDGTQMYGTISDVSERGLQLNGACQRANILSTDAGKAAVQLNSLKQKAKTSAYGYGGGYGNYGGYGGYNGFGYGGNPLAWTSIALLFLIPFLFI